jgi:glycerophosphoryl diester phosphodiesterase
MTMDANTAPARGRTAISAHRGGSEHASPATWEAYQSSVEIGAEYVEFDIRRVRDGDMVVYHDERVNHSGPPLSELSYAELCELAGYDVPKVDEVMKLIAGKSIGHLDLKEIGYENEVISLATDILGDGNFVATSLEDISIAQIKQAFPNVRAALSLGRELSDRSFRQKVGVRRSELFPLRRIGESGADWVAVNYQLARLGVLGQCGRHGIGAMVWTVNDNDMIRKLLADQRVDVLITDKPEEAARIRAELPARNAE